MAKSLRRRASAAAGVTQADNTVACVIDRSAVIVSHRETKIIIFVYGVLLTLVAVGVAPLAASSIAISAGAALYTTLKTA